MVYSFILISFHLEMEPAMRKQEDTEHAWKI